MFYNFLLYYYNVFVIFPTFFGGDLGLDKPSILVYNAPHMQDIRFGIEGLSAAGLRSPLKKRSIPHFTPLSSTNFLTFLFQ